MADLGCPFGCIVYSIVYNRRNFISENFVILTSNLHFLCLTVLFCFGLARALLSNVHLHRFFLIFILFIFFVLLLE